MTVTGANGLAVSGLAAADLILFDNGVPQKIQVQMADAPISLAVLIQVSPNASAVLAPRFTFSIRATLPASISSS